MMDDGNIIELDLTQPADDIPIQQGDTVPVMPPTFPYARLRSIAPFATQVDLVHDVTTVGRSEEATYSVGLQGNIPAWNRQISKKHFEIHRDRQKQITFIKDISLNGTFINGRRIRKEELVQLDFGDVIAFGESLPDVDYNVFVYSDLTAERIYPRQFTNSYIMTGVALGKGGYGNVELGRLRLNCSKKFAVKELLKEKFAVNFNCRISKFEEIKNEAELMMKLDHPNIVQCVAWVDTEDSAYLVMEYVSGGEFFSLITHPKWQKRGLGDALGRFYAYQLLSAVAFLHERGICHRDIKPENILVMDSCTQTVIKLADFGLAKSGDASTMKTCCGTPCYTAPEIIENDGSTYLMKVDIWSLGVVLFTAFTGYPPFSADYSDMPLNDQIRQGRIFLLKHWNNIRVDSQNALLKMLRVDQVRRPTANELLAMEWMIGTDANRASMMMKEHARKKLLKTPAYRNLQKRAY